MICQAHSRERCTVARCAVLAQCFHLLDESVVYTNDDLACPGVWCGRWSHAWKATVRQFGYDLDAAHRSIGFQPPSLSDFPGKASGSWMDYVEQTLARQICARFITWVRWTGVSCQQCGCVARQSCERCVNGICGTCNAHHSHQTRPPHPLTSTFGDRQARRRLVRGERGANWGGLFVLCDYFASAEGAGLWTIVHRWRPTAVPVLERGMSLLLDHSSRGRIPLVETANLLADA